MTTTDAPARVVAERAPARALVVTGATGWLGRATLALARRRWGADADRLVRAYGSREGRVETPGGGFPVRPLAELPRADLSETLVLHYAFLTKDRVAGDRSAFVAANVAIDDAVLSAARRTPPAGLFVASSGAARQVELGGGELYGVAKLMQEQSFAALRRELGVPVFIGRIWSLAGPFINKPHAYALAAFLLQARREGRVAIRASTPVYRSYLHVEDLVLVVLDALARPDRVPAAVIDLAGAQIVEMADVAAEAARAAGLPESAVERGAVDLDRASVFVGDAVAMRTLALASGRRLRPFARQVDDTLAYLDTMQDTPGG